MDCDLILYGGPVFFSEEADAVAVRCGRIVGVGKREELFPLRGPRTRAIDLRGRPLLPGFFDAHTHFLEVGLELTYFVDLSQAGSAAEALELLAQAARERPQEWVIGRGWDESSWPVRRYLERGDLDRAVPRGPALAMRVDGHLLVANTLALARCGRPEGELWDRERGHLWEEAAWELLSCAEPDRETLVEAVAAATRHAARLGVTAVADMGAPRGLPACLEALRRGLLRTRVFLYLPIGELEHLHALGIGGGFGGELLRISGVKAFVDGSIGARTAALFAPYVDGEGRGELLLGREELARLWQRAAEADLGVAVHAIGDRAIEEVLAAGELAGVSGRGRHRIEHLELVTPGQLCRMEKLGLVASMQPNFVARWSGPGGLYEARLGPERDSRSDPHAWVWERGIPLAFGSDGMPMGPLYGIGGVLSPPHLPQKLPLEVALRAYTEGAAYAAGAPELGSITPGSWADFVVLSNDPHTTPWEEVEVDMTFLGGELIYERQVG